MLLRAFIFIISFMFLSLNSIYAGPTEDLLDAALKGDLQKAEAAITAGADVNGRVEERIKSIKLETSSYKEGSTSLILASGEGHLGLVKLLISHKADIQIQNKSGITALSEASFAGHYEIVKLLLSLKIQDDQALYQAVSGQHIQIVKLLIEYKVNLNAISSNGDTALTAAVEKKNVEIVKLLLESGADPNIKNNDNNTALTITVRNNSLELTQLLINYKADLNIRCTWSKTALHWAIYDGNLEIAKLLVENKADIHIKDNLGYTPFLEALGQKNREEFLLYLLEKGAKLDDAANSAFSTLMAASANGYINIVKLLIENKVNINSKNNEGWTALFYALLHNNLEIAKVLIQNGSDINAIEKDGNSVLIKSIEWIKANDTLHLLIQNNADVNLANHQGMTPLMEASFKNQLAIVNVLIKNGATVNAKNKDGLSALLMSLHNKEVVSFLLNQGAELPDRTENGFITLIKAIEVQNDEVIKKLIKSETDVNAKDKDGNTGLMIASEQGEIKVLKLLLENKANPNLWDKNGNTALIKASRNGKLEAVKLLIDFKADPNIRNQEGDNSFLISLKENKMNIAIYLINFLNLSFGTSELELDFTILSFFKMIHQLNSYEEKDKSRFLSALIVKLESDVERNPINYTLLWFLYKEMETKEYTKQADKIFSKIKSEVIPNLMYELNDEYTLSGRLYFYLGEFYSLRKKFHKANTFLELAEESEKKWLNIAFKSKGYKFYIEESVRLKKGLAFITLESQKKPFLLLQNGHKNPGLLFSPDGERILTFSENTAKLWRKNGKLIYNLEGHTSSIIASFSPDGSKVLTSSDDSIKVWNQKGEIISNFNSGQKDTVSYFRKDGNSIFTVSKFRIARIWSIYGKLISESETIFGWGDKIDYLQENDILINKAWYNSKIEFRDTKLNLLHELDNQVSYKVSPDEKNMITISSDKIIKIWDISQIGKTKNPSLLKEMKRSEKLSNKILSFSQDGKYFATALEDNSIEIRDLNGNVIFKLESQISPIEYVSFISKKNLILSISDSKAKIRNWEGKLIDELSNATSVITSKDHQLLAAISDSAKIFNISSLNKNNSLTEICEIKDNSSRVSSVTFSPDSKSFVIGGEFFSKKGKIYHLDSKTNTDINGSYNGIKKAVFARDGKSFITSTWSPVAYIWDKDGNQKAELEFTHHINRIVFSENGEIIAGASNNTVRIWNKNGQHISDLNGHTNLVLGIGFSKNEKLIATASYDGVIKIWDISRLDQDAKVLKELKWENENILEVIFISDHSISIKSISGKIRILDLNGTIIKEYRNRVPFSGVFGVGDTQIVSDNGKYLVLVDGNNINIIDNIKYNKCISSTIARLKSHTSAISSLQFIQNGKILVSTSTDNTLKYWDFESIVNSNTKTHGRASLRATQIFFTDNSSLIYTPDGRFDYTDKSALNYVSYRAPSIQSGFIDLQDVYNQYYTPGLMKDILEGNVGTVYNENSFTKAVETVPDLKVLNLDSQRKLSADTESIDLMFQARDKGGGIDHVEVFVNGMQVTNVSRDADTEESVYGNDTDGTDKSKSGIEKSASGKAGSDKILNNEKDIKTHKFSADLNRNLKKGSRLKAVIQENSHGIQSMNVYIDGQKKPIVFRSAGNRKKGSPEEGTARNIEFTETRKGPPVNFTAEIPIAPGLNRIEIKAFNKAKVSQNYPVIEVVRELPSGADAVKPRLYILSVGVNNYSKNKLTYSVNDAKAVAETIRSNAGDLYSEVKTVLLLDSDASRKNIIESLENIGKNAKPEDVIVLYFSGHGMNAIRENKRPLFYFVPQDFPWPDNPESESIAVRYGIDGETLNESLGKMKSHKVILILDACHSGAIQMAMAKGDGKTEETKRQMERMANGTGRFIFASSSGSELSREHKEVGHGLYTYVLLNAMGYNKSKNIPDAEIKPDGDIYLWELESYIKANFEDQTKGYLNGIIQTPPVMSLGRNEMNARVNDFPFLRVRK